MRIIINGGQKESIIAESTVHVTAETFLYIQVAVFFRNGRSSNQ